MSQKCIAGRTDAPFKVRQVGAARGQGIAVKPTAKAPDELKITADEIVGQLAALPSASIGDLKQQWRSLFAKEPPTSNRRYLESRLAYRIQELAFGGLSDLTMNRLHALAARLEQEPPAPKRRDAGRLVEGTRLIREWKGIEYTVTVRRDGFEFQGRPYRTLSPIARAITGTNWNGPVFFGLQRGSARNGSR
jgi:hypothetical protein